jgi:hypothetical protein
MEDFMKAIFLDVDGVLNSDKYFDKIINLNINGIEKDVDIEKILLLKEDKNFADSYPLLAIPNINIFLFSNIFPPICSFLFFLLILLSF